jgi:hypothetical protein
MGRPTPVDDERWRDEAAGAVLGDDEWRYVAAGMTLDRSKLLALYEHRPTRARVSVKLEREKCRSIWQRVAEIKRQLAGSVFDGTAASATPTVLTRRRAT